MNNSNDDDWEYIDREHVVLDFLGCRNLHAVHTMLARELCFPDYYGKNWDALWDCFRDYYTEPMRVEIHNLLSLPPVFEESMAIMKSVFDDIHAEYPSVEFIYVS